MSQLDQFFAQADAFVDLIHEMDDANTAIAEYEAERRMDAGPEDAPPECKRHPGRSADTCQSNSPSSNHDGICRHGTYVGGCGIDWMCGFCENGV